MSEAAPAVGRTVLAPWLQTQLQTLLQHRGHALLLAGPSGLGQYDLALALARSWLCERPTPQGACGECGSCHAVDVRTHADLRVLMPETLCLELGWPLDEATQKELDDKKRKPSKLIRVDPAERMNMESANTLLKTLEEPLGEVRFVLATEAAQQLLPTIRSRCQTHVMHWPAPAESLTWLQEAAHRASGKAVPAELASVWLRAAGGRPVDALRWASAGLQSQAWAQLPQALARGDWSLMADWPPAQQLEVLQKLCHDLMSMRAGAEPRFFEAAQLPAPPRWSALSTWSRELFTAARSVEHPYNAGLMQQAWSARTRQVLAATGGL
jgi:DNA polymerase-3 subunit delta'